MFKDYQALVYAVELQKDIVSLAQIDGDTLVANLAQNVLDFLAGYLEESDYNRLELNAESALAEADSADQTGQVVSH